MAKRKVITRIKGGLGNQLFCYAAARRMALVNEAELIIDNVTGFARDRQYCRRYMLDRFPIYGRNATPQERLEPFERYRRKALRELSRRRSFSARRYLEQEGRDFDPRVLGFQVRRTVYLDGYWQSELYFKDVAEFIRKDLQMTPPSDEQNQHLGRLVRSKNAVAVHVRWFDPPLHAGENNAPISYYKAAVSRIEREVPSPHYFIFSDYPEANSEKLALPHGRATSVVQVRGEGGAYEDLWLMSQCRHFIIANSTFSWWGAWLADRGTVMVPDLGVEGKTSWGFKGLIPDRWMKV